MTDTDTDTRYREDRVARIRRTDGTPTPEQVAKYLPSNYRIGRVDSWQIIVRGQDDAGWTLDDYVIPRLGSGLIHAEEVQREGREAVYQFRTGKDSGSGSLLSPPGHPNLAYSIYGYHSAGSGRPRTDRPSGPDMIMALTSMAEDEDGYYPAADVRRARRILGEASTEPAEEWVRQTYGYFAHSYSPDGTDRNVSHAISASKLHCRCGEEFWNRKGLNYHIDRESGPRGGYRGHEEIAKPIPPADRHLGYLMVREYFPGHRPRLELITHPEGLYGNRECVKCQQRVQYESRWDKWAKFGSGPDCPQGGDHETAPPEGEDARQQFLAEHACDGCGCQS